MRPSLTWIHNQAMHPATSEQRKNLRHQGAGTKNLRDAPSNCKFNELHQGASVRPELSSMSDPTSSALAAITSVASSVPAQVQTAFHAALSQLLGGLTAIPAAWSKQKAQAIEDVTVGRSLVAASLAKAVADASVTDHAMMKAAAEIYLPAQVRKAYNLVQVAQLTAERIAEDNKNTDGSSAESPNTDWMNSFMRFAEDASSDRLQDLFSRILAGEIIRPGAFSLSTLRTISEMDQAIAADFSWAWAKSVGEAVHYGAAWQRGDGFARWKRLAEAGLMAATDAAQYLPAFHPFPHLNNYSLWSPMRAGGNSLLVYFREDCSARWPHIMFTRTGQQLGSLIAPPAYEANMREAASDIAALGVSRIDLQLAGGREEVLFVAQP
jgi:hypothetical protein